MADFLHEKRSEIGMRLKELKPLVDEYERLEAAAAALAGVPSASVATAAPRRTARRAATASPPQREAAPTKRRRGRPKGSGTRGNEALELIKASPGITIPELAAQMGIKPNYLHRVLPGLAQDGLVTKQGRGWHLKKAT
jgi:hypothetical protein